MWTVGGGFRFIINGEIMFSKAGEISLFLSCLLIDSIIISLKMERKKTRKVLRKSPVKKRAINACLHNTVSHFLILAHALHGGLGHLAGAHEKRVPSSAFHCSRIFAFGTSNLQPPTSSLPIPFLTAWWSDSTLQLCKP
jgi:hypothetical protein